MAASGAAFGAPHPNAFEALDSLAGRGFAGHKIVKIPKTGDFPFRHVSRSRSLSRQAFLNHSPVKVGQRTTMLLPELPSPLSTVPTTQDFDALPLDSLQEPVNICSSVRNANVRDKSVGLSKSLPPARVSLLCNIALSIALIFSLFVSMRQNDTIKDQRQNIFEMSQNPYCTGAPGFRGRPAASRAVPSVPVVQDN
jgi:hypothetical protein